MKNEKGLAMAYFVPEDLITLGVSWYYTWNVYQPNMPPGFVPMSRNGEDPNLPLDYSGYVLLFNEPNNIEPYGHPITPENGAQIYIGFVEKYPKAKWVVGNVSVWSWDWLADFRDNCGNYKLPDAWGIHAYIEMFIDLTTTKMLLNAAHNNLGGKFWITEFADTTGNVKNDDRLTDYFYNTSWIERWSYFTNRATGSESWYPKYWNKVQLFDFETNELTAIGEWYAKDKKPYFIWLPFIKKDV